MSRPGQHIAGRTDTTPLHETQYRPEGEDSIAFCIIDAIATAAEVSAFDIDDQLYHSVDPEALEQVFRESALGPHGQVAFEFAGYEVVTHSSGVISVYEN